VFRGVLSDERSEERRLSSAGRSEYAQHFSGARFEIDAAEDVFASSSDPQCPRYQRRGCGRR
jgi:hypothetical protein